MTISLEEHVARAIADALQEDVRIWHKEAARAAIAAVHEHAPDPAEAMRANERLTDDQLDQLTEIAQSGIGGLDQSNAMSVIHEVRVLRAALKGKGE